MPRGDGRGPMGMGQGIGQGMRMDQAIGPRCGGGRQGVGREQGMGMRRGMGNGNSYSVCNRADLVESKLGRGFGCKIGFRRGGGQGLGGCFDLGPSLENPEKELLERQKEMLEDRLSTITDQLDKFE